MFGPTAGPGGLFPSSSFPSVSLLAAIVAHAQPAPESTPAAKPRPKVGLVLSGGGARGLTHVGVLKVLHEMRVPIDYIAAHVDGRDRRRPVRERHDARRRCSASWAR